MNLAYRLAARHADGDAADATLPGSLLLNRRLGQWLRFRSEEYVEVYPGKVDIGQGISTALAQIVADELDVPLACVRMMRPSTATSPDEAVTSGSLSIQECGTALRHACAEARAIYLEAAATRLDAGVQPLRVEAGRFIAAGGGETSYWALADDDLLDRDATGRGRPKSPAALRIIGASVPRLDLPAKFFGSHPFIHDLVLPDLLHGRMLRPPSPGAILHSVDGTAVLALPGMMEIVRDGSFLGVLAASEQAADAAIEKLALSAIWHESATLPDAHALPAWLKEQPVESTVVADRTAASMPPAARTLRASYSRPYLAHGSLAPSCALAQWHEASLHVWCHSQGIFNLRTDLALAFALEPGAIVVEHVEGAGCYGHNGADDVAFDAARLARVVAGRPVRVQWSRADELTCAPFGPAMAVDLEADLDQANRIVGWRHSIWSNGHSTRPGRAKSPALLGSWQLAAPFERLIAVNAPLAAGGGSDRNSIPLYDFPAWHIVNHRLLAMPLRTSALRALGGYANVFAIESFMDEIASELHEDAVAFRLRHLSDPRAREVIERAASKAGWGARRKEEGAGRGIGFAKYKNTGAYCAVVADILAEETVRVRRLTIAVDLGLVINPDGVVNQIEGGAIQATSWTLREAVRFDATRVTSTSWEEYPILKFSEVPAVEVELVARPEAPAVGAGEAALGPTAAAIANAVADALGVRLRDLPFTRERLVAALTA